MSDPPFEDRGRSEAAVVRAPWMSRRTLTVVLVVGVALLGGFATWRMSATREAPPQEKLPEKIAAVEPYVAPKMALPPTPVAAAPLMPNFVNRQPDPPAQPPPLVLPAQRTQASANPPAPAKPHMLSFAVPEPRRPPGAGGPGGASGAEAPGKPPVTYASTSVPGIEAGLVGDQTFLLMPQLLPCTMDWAVNSTFEGPIQCHIDRDIKPRGIVLINRNAVVHGYYKGNIQEGQTRLFAAADWMEDPVSGCIINFDNAPLGDGIGQTGMTGNIDNQYMKRFGAAFALTGFQSLMQILQAEIQKNAQGNTYLSLNSGGGIDSLAAAILHKQIDIPAIISTHQGDEIAVITSKILNFSRCYSLQLKDR